MVFQSCIWKVGKWRGGGGGLAGNNESESEWILNNFGHREGQRERGSEEKINLTCK